MACSLGLDLADRSPRPERGSQRFTRKSLGCDRNSVGRKAGCRFDSRGPRFRLSFVLGPGDRDNRDKIYELAKKWHDEKKIKLA